MTVDTLFKLLPPAAELGRVEPADLAAVTVSELLRRGRIEHRAFSFAKLTLARSSGPSGKKMRENVTRKSPLLLSGSQQLLGPTRQP